MITAQKSRPDEKAANPLTENDSQYSTGTGLQARRAAALRLPPLESGHRDPLDEIPAMSGPAQRALCNELYRMGFDLAYLEHRFGLRRAGTDQLWAGASK